MATLDKVMQMQAQGMNDSEIIGSLQNEGVSAKEINDSLAQAKIKTAVTQPPQEEYQAYAPQTQAAPQADQYQTYTQTPQTYSEQGYYPEQSSMSVDTVSEIVDRLLIEKLKDLNNKIKQVSDFKVKAEQDIIDIKDRLKRIESTIDSLQKSVIGKVGEFGQSTELIHKDLENLHGTVSKLMNPLVDNYNELKRMREQRK